MARHARRKLKPQPQGDGTDVRASVEALVSLGFTPLEAEVYTFLVRASPATGYRVAQTLGKVPPNVYSALDALRQKGAILVEQGSSRLCRAVPYEELLCQLESRFLECRRQAAKSLSRLPAAPVDERVYQLSTRNQVLQQCRTMLRDCGQIAVLDISPEPLANISPDLRHTIERGVEVILRVEQEVEFPSATVVVSPPRSSLDLEPWVGNWLNIVVDGSEHLLAYLARDGKGVHQATWSRSVYLSYVFHCSLLGEIQVDLLLRELQTEASSEEIRQRALDCLERWIKLTPARNLLIERFGT